MTKNKNKNWDESMLSLLRASPQAFVDLFLPGTRYIQEQPQKLQSHPCIIDGLVEVDLEGERLLIHFEFQSYYEPNMQERLLEYNVLIWNEYHMPVLSCVVHLLSDTPITPSPFKRHLFTGKEIVNFAYETLEISHFMAQDILQMGQPGLLPLLTLTKDGATRHVVELMFRELETFADTNVTFIAFTIATYSFQRSNRQDVSWLERSYKHMHDILVESPFYKEIIARGLEQGIKQGIEQGRELGIKQGRELGIEQGRELGIEQGIEQGLEKGQITALRQAIIDVVQERLPALTDLARTEVETIHDATQLRRLVVKMSTVTGNEQAVQAFASVRQKH